MREGNGEHRRRDFQQTQETLFVRHILPKANEIVKTSEQIFKSIYPFELVPPAPSKSLQCGIAGGSYQPRLPKCKFTSLFSSIDEHFDKNLIVYDKFNFGNQGKITAMNICSIDKLKSLSKNDFIISVEKTSPFSQEQSILQFDSRFQSGNLAYASRVRDTHCLLLHNDVNTTGYTNWFYFSVKSKDKTRGKFAIMNYGKAGWPMNSFPGICLWSQKNQRWQRKNCGVSCQANANLYSKCGQFQKFNTLYFEFDFQPQDKIFFAYNPPYTYTDMLKTLDSIEEQKLMHFHRKLAGTSLIGNRLQMLTITNFQNLRKGESELPVIVMMARTHAGQTVSSWIIHYFIKFLVSQHPEAVILRDNFVFKIFPMLNPDGVAHGNYRCSLIGRDLNRRWKTPAKELYPQVYFVKNQILDTHQQRQIKMVLDLHGHTQKRRVFFYGCADRSTPHKARLFPYLASKLSVSFEFASCNFAMQKSKQATARITLYNIIKSPQIFTIQTSQFGLGDKFLSSQVFREIALTLCRCLIRFYKIESTNNSQLKNDIEEYQDELIANPNLLKVGCDPSDGSDSQPSVCNLQFDKINKLAQNNKPRPLTQSLSPKRKTLIRPQSYKKPPVERRQFGLSVNSSRQMKEKTLSPTIPIRIGSSMSQKRQQIRTKVRQPNKLQYTKDIQSSLKLQQLGGEVQRRTVRMINFELLIDEGRRKSSLRQAFESADLRANHINYHMFQRRCVFRNRSYNWKGSV